ncbi:O-acetyltransferase [Staphylococcus petrasii]|uniref:Acetyltransferase n=1 Tax=Staphylococcus petrasii TaxID=1276936 RepID=A0A380G2Z9_9STAP|nr:DapH/DapD/GlmU-related protein [Staphylococcus petrasii]PNZ28052.1 acetyltransferase [Staphylococcus petrasii]TGE13050.1 acetyltransferase [Staphylococcus petrasii]TGE18838.1 acetyltransferase [Staphylococcus petrasii]SUM44856.1 O-acetyltransferase [Staphylococcus petrasii]
MRRLTKITRQAVNPLWRIYRFVSFPKTFRNTLIIEVCRYIPNLKLKRWMYIHFLKMKIGKQTAIAYKVMMDIFYPQLISIGNNCVIGYNTTILTHEVLVEEYRYGPVTIGHNTLIGANTTILPGINIGDNVTVKAGTIVSKDIPDNAIAYGNPMHIQYK